MGEKLKNKKYEFKYEFFILQSLIYFSFLVFCLLYSYPFSMERDGVFLKVFGLCAIVGFSFIFYLMLNNRCLFSYKKLLLFGIGSVFLSPLIWAALWIVAGGISMVGILFCGYGSEWYRENCPEMGAAMWLMHIVSCYPITYALITQYFYEEKNKLIKKHNRKKWRASYGIGK